MRTDREALIAGIAADPANDLRKLVFADWLEEHGEPERAEFIRLAIGNKNAETRTKATEERAKALFAKHWRTWFGPFLEALDTVRGVDGFEPAPERFEFQATQGSQSCVEHRLDAVEGFVSRVSLNSGRLPSGTPLDRAFRLEPVGCLHLALAENPRWQEATGLALDQLHRLSIEFRMYFGTGSLRVFEQVMNDPHMGAINSSCLWINGSISDTPPHAFTAPFAVSRMASTVRDLQLFGHHIDGLQPLCDSDRFRLERLHLSLEGRLSRQCGEMLSAAGFADSMKSLEIEAPYSTVGQVSPIVAALAEGKRWTALAELKIDAREKPGVTDVGLRALAKATFLPQLEVLHLPFDGNPDPKLVAAVVERLDPDRIRHLVFGSCGNVPLPDCFVRKFGKSALGHTDEESGNFWHVRSPNS